MDTQSLVESAQKGDDEAFYLLIEANKEKLYRIAYSYLRNETECLEAVQEVTYRAYVKIKKLRNPQYFDTWLIRILMNYCTDELKKRKRTVYKQVDIDEYPAATSEDQWIDVQRLDIESILTQIEPKYQAVINLKYVHDFTITEIAQTLEKPEGTIKTWLTKALKLIRKQLEEGGVYHA